MFSFPWATPPRSIFCGHLSSGMVSRGRLVLTKRFTNKGSGSKVREGWSGRGFVIVFLTLSPRTLCRLNLHTQGSELREEGADKAPTERCHQKGQQRGRNQASWKRYRSVCLWARIQADDNARRGVELAWFLAIFDADSPTRWPWTWPLFHCELEGRWASISSMFC